MIDRIDNNENQCNEDELELYYGLLDIGENLIREGF